MITNEEKLAIVSQHIKNLELNKFNLELSLIEENAKLDPEQDNITPIETEIDDVVAKITALTVELNKIPR
jgi:hypothetical protein